MKKTFLLFSFLVLGISIYAQRSNLVIFSENGERFQVVLNGILQNAQAETNVMITDLVAPSYQAKILFEDANIPDLEKTIYFQDMNVQLTMKIKQNKKGAYVLRLFNTVPLAQAPPRSATQPVVVFTTVPPATTTVTHSTTTTTTHGQPVGGENVNVNMNMGGVNMNVNVNASGNTGTTYSETHTVTTTTSSNVDGSFHGTDPEHYVLPGYSGPYGCPFPMAPHDFEDAKRSISSKSFSDSRVTLAKQIIDSNCLLSTQVMEIMQLFDFEDDRLEIAKYAYGYTLDYGNYYKVNNAFEFESTIDELNEYMNSFRR
jgi:hypothetical protein